MQIVNTTLHTSGDGYWSTAAKAVEVKGLEIGYVSEDRQFGELRVYFNTDTWAVESDGLIYTDKQFYVELQDYIKQQGLVVDLCYSEQGMQGEDYVSLDIGADFIASWVAKFGEQTIADVWVND